MRIPQVERIRLSQTSEQREQSQVTPRMRQRPHCVSMSLCSSLAMS